MVYVGLYSVRRKLSFHDSPVNEHLYIFNRNRPFNTEIFSYANFSKQDTAAIMDFHDDDV